MSANNFGEDWWQWRNSRDEHDRAVDRTLAEHNTEIALLKYQQKVTEDNAEARHSRGPQHLYWLVSGAFGLIALILQLLAAKGGTP